MTTDPVNHRLEALRLHKELIDRFSLEDVREIIRHLTMVEAVLTRVDEGEPPITVIDPSG